MNFRITDDGNEHDIHEIHEMLRDYNLRHREASETVPLGVFLEDETGRKFAGLTAETFGNWLCIRFLFVGEAFRDQGLGSRLLEAAENVANLLEAGELVPMAVPPTARIAAYRRSEKKDIREIRSFLYNLVCRLKEGCDIV